MRVDRLGLGVMIGMLGDNKQTVGALEKAEGKTIRKLKMEEDMLTLYFDEGKLKLWDSGQTCCEHRYMHTDDVIEHFAGADFLNVEVREAPDIDDEYGEHEVQFLLVNTSIGTFTIETHNEHNGWYGGFWIQAGWRDAT